MNSPHPSTKLFAKSEEYILNPFGETRSLSNSYNPAKNGIII